jgi:putative DeoR family transcriptional regulator (stage III sporulation protein D)
MRKNNQYLEERILEEAKYIINTGSTLRKAAKVFGVSKSTIHKDMRKLLPEVSPLRALEVREVLNENLAERHIRGGISTQLKYKNAN